jgi:hydrogenase nickel incorporation protein HypA/HybF
MHEFNICEDLLDQVAKEHAKQPFAGVTRVRVEIGQLSTADPEALQYAFEILTRQTFLEGAVLQIDRVPSRGHCLDCGAEVEVAAYPAACPHCHGARIKPGSGNRAQFIEIEVV